MVFFARVQEFRPQRLGYKRKVLDTRPSLNTKRGRGLQTGVLIYAALRVC